MPLHLETEQLIMREWRKGDFAEYHAMNQDGAVRDYYPGLQSLEKSKAFMARAAEQDAKHGYFFQPVFEKASGRFVGDLGLAKIEFDAPFAGGTEIGWMLKQQYWGQGYAVEMARALLEYAFRTVALPEVVAFTVPTNLKSRRVMEKLGMQHDKDGDFEHPSIPEGHPYRPHVLYRMTAP